ncbi:hypothetical protein T265_09427 [Opisthorchis viverrini]|uniref:Uncharacterized protein n=1 Tax=Opisthorchis viverrini TaxID=6198 RepID=A0A074ZA88_OPIVI|nr:hypothetical protein T265_09427 [Opisthorchis viverrini]KER22507.1 hypothetical protein T265_09427 [Opisthorchis viverrini]
MRDMVSIRIKDCMLKHRRERSTATINEALGSLVPGQIVKLHRLNGLDVVRTRHHPHYAMHLIGDGHMMVIPRLRDGE